MLPAQARMGLRRLAWPARGKRPTVGPLQPLPYSNRTPNRPDNGCRGYGDAAAGRAAAGTHRAPDGDPQRL